jgi:hypothetical protein
MQVDIICSRCKYKFGTKALSGTERKVIEVNPTCDCGQFLRHHLHARKLRRIADQLIGRDTKTKTMRRSLLHIARRLEL